MTAPRDIAEARHVRGQGRILEALAEDNAVLIGTLERLSKQFGLAPDDLRTCLLELMRAGWIAVQTQPFGRLTVRLERRLHETPPPAVGERRRSVPDAWRL
jgi:DNA-binding transcriptional regulator PaaX